MAAINKNFVIKNGLEVNTDLIFADIVTDKVGIGTTNPQYTLHVSGGIGVTNLYVSGIATITTGIVTNLTSTNLTGTAGTITTFNSTNLRSTNLNVTGIGTIATLNATGIAVTNFTVGGISTFTNGPVLIGSGTSTGTASQRLQVTGGTYVSGNLGIGSTNPTSKLHVVGDARITGVVTATTFSGAVSGIAASATQLVTPRTFEITGDVVASPISFDGTGNVSLAATIQPNSVGLGTDTTGDYVRDITGTSNQISVSVTSGEGSTPTLSVPNQFTAPQDVTVTRDLLVNRNLNVNGNITIGGTSATLFTTELKISDPDIVLGFRTDGSGNDVSNDNTANHGGVALASTEGTPLVQLFIAGIETNPPTYKKIMWFKSGTFAGLGTDAWLINYAVGIGSTQFPLGTRLAAGNVQFTQNDLAVVRNINSSGIVTATTFIGNVNAGVGTITTFNSTNGTITNGTITNLTGTAATIGTVKIVSGIITATSGIVTYYGDGTYLTGTASSPNLQAVLNTGNTSNIGFSITGVSTLTTLNSTSGTITNLSGVNINVTGVVTATSFVGSGANLTGIANTANIVSTAITTGILNVTTSAVIGSGVTINSSGINVTGVVTATSFVGNGSGLTGAGSTVADDTTTNQEFFPLFTATTSGTITASGISTSKLTYNPSTGAMTAVDFNSTSDINLKENIRTVGNALEITEQLRGVSFDWKETGRSSYGVIAQELEEVLPELVTQGDVKSVNYNGLIGVLIEAVKEQQKQIEELKNTK